jgi:hypothetical protein
VITYWDGVKTTTANVYVGPVWLNVLDGTTRTTQRMLCVDLLGEIRDGQTWNVTKQFGPGALPTGLNGDVDAWDKIAWMTKFSAPGWDAAVPTETPGIADNGVRDAALQASIWEVIQDNHTHDLTGFDLSNGNFVLQDALLRSQIGNAITSGAFRLPTTADNYSGSGAGQPWYEANTTGQDMVYFFVDGTSQGGPQVPEFPVSALAPIGLAVVGLVRRKFSA